MSEVAVALDPNLFLSNSTENFHLLFLSVVGLTFLTE